VVGEETWDAGDAVETGYETANSPGSTANTFWPTLCCTLFLVGGKSFRNLFAMKVPIFRHSSSAKAAADAAAADDGSH
jgi:hypothetical protein